MNTIQESIKAAAKASNEVNDMLIYKKNTDLRKWCIEQAIETMNFSRVINYTRSYADVVSLADEIEKYVMNGKMNE